MDDFGDFRFSYRFEKVYFDEICFPYRLEKLYSIESGVPYRFETCTKTTDSEGEQSKSGKKNGTLPGFEPGSIEILRVIQALSDHHHERSLISKEGNQKNENLDFRFPYRFESYTQM